MLIFFTSYWKDVLSSTLGILRIFWPKVPNFPHHSQKLVPQPARNRIIRFSQQWPKLFSTNYLLLFTFFCCSDNYMTKQLKEWRLQASSLSLRAQSFMVEWPESRCPERASNIVYTIRIQRQILVLSLLSPFYPVLDTKPWHYYSIFSWTFL